MFGENLKRIREERGLSQAELAKEVGVHQTMISLLESGATRPRYDTLLSLLKALNVALEELEPQSTPAI